MPKRSKSQSAAPSSDLQNDSSAGHGRHTSTHINPLHQPLNPSSGSRQQHHQQQQPMPEASFTGEGGTSVTRAIFSCSSKCL